MQSIAALPNVMLKKDLTLNIFKFLHITDLTEWAEVSEQNTRDFQLYVAEDLGSEGGEDKLDTVKISGTVSSDSEFHVCCVRLLKKACWIAANCDDLCNFVPHLPDSFTEELTSNILEKHFKCHTRPQMPQRKTIGLLTVNTDQLFFLKYFHPQHRLSIGGDVVASLDAGLLSGINCIQIWPELTAMWQPILDVMTSPSLEIHIDEDEIPNFTIEFILKIVKEWQANTRIIDWFEFHLSYMQALTFDAQGFLNSLENQLNGSAMWIVHPNNDPLNRPIFAMEILNLERTGQLFAMIEIIRLDYHGFRLDFTLSSTV